MIWTAITDFGDSAVMGPVALGIALWLSASRAWRGALAWALLFGSGALIVVCTKIAYVAWGLGVEPLDFTGISGHAMSATSVFAVGGYLIGRWISRAAALAAAGAGVAIGVTVGVSRIVLGEHSPAEVVAGCALGAAVAVAAISVLRLHPAKLAAPAAFGLAILALAFALHGHRAPTEPLTVRIALYLSGHAAPYTRAPR
jgi:membrane-associated phospholipid phosphatase